MIEVTEKLTKEYCEKFIYELVNGHIPMDLKIGNSSIADTDYIFDAPVATDDGFCRYGKMSNVEIKVDYRVFGGAVEIGATLTNTQNENSPQIYDIDICKMELSDAQPFDYAWMSRRVLYSLGSTASVYDFAPREADLNRPSELLLEEKGGRSSESYMPYFNCASYNQEGVILAIGWSGHWRAHFKNGQDRMHIKLSYPANFYLKPNESVKLPTVLVMPWKRIDDGDRDLTDTFLLFRRLMRGYVIPKNFQKGLVTLRSWGGDSVAIHEKKFANMKKFDINCDAYGIDAGWFELDGNGIAGNWPSTVGDWHEAKTLLPDGLEWLSKNGRKSGANGFWLWFEFERAVEQSAAYKAHPEYYLKGTGQQWCGKFCLVDMGNPAAREYIKNILYPIIKRAGITMFRVDFNIDPIGHFNDNDEYCRHGITELKYYNGLYDFFEEMLQNFPDLYIDNCAGGGTRLDYHLCKYALPVQCRSDYFTIKGDHTIGQQSQTIGLSRWLPVHGDSAYSCTINNMPVPKDTYADRSCYCANYSLVAFSGDLNDEDGKRYKKIVDEAYIVRDFMSLDFYPLTGYSLSPLDWCAFELCAEDSSRAMVMAFRREHNKTPKQIYALKGLNENDMYQITDLDSDAIVKLSGKQLMAGFEIEIPKARDSRIFIIQNLCK